MPESVAVHTVKIGTSSSEENRSKFEKSISNALLYALVISVVKHSK
jgi:hypothetical protein